MRLRIIFFIALLPLALPSWANAPDCQVVAISPGTTTLECTCPSEPPPAPFCGDLICDPGENQCECSIDCGPSPQSEAGLCTDGVDNDCDGPPDCSDSDCASDPACSTPAACFDGACSASEDCFTCWVDCQASCPAASCGNGICQAGEGTATCSPDCDTPSGPPSVGLERWYRYDRVHVPSSTGTRVHHFPNLAPGDAVGAHAQGWDVDHEAEAVSGGVYFSSTRKDSYSIAPEFASTTGWTYAYVGTIESSGSALLGSDGESCDNLNRVSAEVVTGTGGMGRFAIRMNASGDVRPAQPFITFGTPLAFILTHDRASGAFGVWHYDGLSWSDVTAVPAATLTRDACWSCHGCYYPWWWASGGNTQEQTFREMMLYSRVVDGADLAQLMAHLEGSSF